MKNFKAEHGPVTVNSGQVRLTAEQAAVRRHCLDAIKINDAGAGTYQVKSQIQFKQGEVFGFDGVIGKNGVLSDPDAERIADLEQGEAMASAAVAAATEKLKAQFKAQIEQRETEHAAALASASDAACEALIASLPEDLAQQVREALAAAQAQG